MSIFALFSLLSAVVCWTLGIYVYQHNKKHPLNRVFLLFCLSLAYWAFTEFMYRQAETYETARFWVKISLSWVFAVAFLTHFALLFTEKHKLLRHKLTYFAIYLPAIIWLIIDITTDSITIGPLKESWGYTYVIPEESTVYWISNLWAIGLGILAFALCVKYYFNVPDKQVKRQVKYISIGLAIPLIAAIITELPLTGKTRIPEMTTLSMTWLAIFVVYAIKKHELFSLKSSGIMEPIIANIPAGIWVARTNPMQTIYMNSQLEQMYQRKLSEFQENPNIWFELIHPEDVKYISSGMEPLLKEGKDYEAEYRIIRPDKSIIWVHASTKAICDASGKASQLWGIVNDITVRKKAEEELRKSEMQLSNAMQLAKLGYWELDIASGIFTFTDNFYSIFRTTAKEIGGYNMSIPDYAKRFVHPDDMPLVAEETRKAIETDDPNFNRQLEHRILYADGSKGYIAVRFFIVKDKSGKTIKTYGVNQDITERKKAEEEKEKLQKQLLQSEKMAAVGTLTGGIAHDFNNILFAIMGNIELLKYDLTPDTETYHLAETVEKSAQRAAKITRELLAFSRPTKSVTSSVNINHTVNEVTELLKHTIEKMIAVKTNLAPDLWKINADSSQIYQVILNMCINAKEAIMARGHGELIIETSNKELSKEDISFHPKARPGKYVMLTISDTGIGMDEETVQRIFEPFFTTKPTGKGGGLGLAVTYNIVKSHNGFITVYSEKGKGTSFKIYLPELTTGQAGMPVSEQPIPDEATKAPEQQTSQKAEGTILVAEDEDAIRTMVKRILERAGYSVIITPDGKQAVEQYRQQKDNIDMVILDLIMPGWSGLETLKVLRKINPNLKVLISSGYSSDSMNEEILKLGINGFIQKPYVIKELLEEVKRIIAGK
jgi:PAS domain S-box-containing protein